MLEITEYWRRMDLSEPISQRVHKVQTFYEDLIAEPIEGAFLSETVGPDGQRVYVSLWFFTARFLLEAHNFVTAQAYDLAPKSDRINHWVANFAEYEPPGPPKPQSRMSVTYTTMSNGNGQLQASGWNCEQLYTVLREVLMPMSTSPLGGSFS